MTDRPMTDGLEPCPFCTGSAYVAGDYGASYSVKCNNPICGAAVRLWGNREGAIAAWNRRSTSAAVRGMREALEKIANMPPSLSVPVLVDQFVVMRMLARLALDGHFAVLSGIETEQEQARSPSALSAPISHGNKDPDQ